MLCERLVFGLASRIQIVMQKRNHTMAIVIAYQEGDVFLLPLRGSGQVIGVVARADFLGVVVVYIFGPVRVGVPDDMEVESLSPSKAVLIARCGDLGLLGQGGYSWPIVGAIPNWRRREWAVPVYCRRGLGGTCFRVEYSDSDLSVTDERPISTQECDALPHDALYGAGALEKVATQLFAEHRK